MFPTASTSSGSRRLVAAALQAAGQGLFIFLFAYLLLGGRARDFHVPLRFGVDSLAYLTQTKTTLENGWWWSNPRLSAPSTFNALLFPSNSTVDQALIGAVGLVTRDLGLTINVSWLLMLALGGVNATWCLGLLGVSRPTALVAGTLFAVHPFAIYRNLEHFMLVTYLVPFSAALAVAVAARRADDRAAAPFWPYYAGCLLTGLNYVYYAFFGAIFLAAATVTGFLSHRRWRLVLPAVVGGALIVGATAVNLAPSLRAWRVEGKPVIIQEKLPGEAEAYGLKIRQLLAPLWGHTVGPLAEWNRRDQWARFPLETENGASRLGLVSSVGFLCGLLAVLGAARLGDRPDGRRVLAAGQLIVVGVLLATIGGFGALFNLFVAADIRGYARVAPFLTFFALLIVAIGCDALRRRSPLAGAALLAGVLAVGLWDQSHAFVGLRDLSPAVRDEYKKLQSLVKEVEAGLPPGSRVLQLPFTLYLNDPGRFRMTTYSQLKPYLASEHLHWSFPALSNRQFQWELAAMKVPPSELPATMAREGFAAIWVDKYGYGDDGAAILATLAAVPGARLAWADERYAVIDIRAVGPATASDLSADPLPVTTSLATCATAPEVSVEYVGGEPGPFDRPIAVDGDADLRVAGWLLLGRPEGLASDLDVKLDDRLLPAYYGFPRPDVAAYRGGPEYQDAGFVALIPKSLLTPGTHTLSLRAASTGGACAGETAALTLSVH